jgi:hypothetical protein
MVRVKDMTSVHQMVDIRTYFGERVSLAHCIGTCMERNAYGLTTTKRAHVQNMISILAIGLSVNVQC